MEEGTVAFAISIEQAVEAEFSKYPKYLAEVEFDSTMDYLW